MPADAAARLREWKRKLLDLSKRNRLIHFKPTRVSTISIVDELPPEVFRSIALEGAAMSFLTRRVGDNPTPVDTTFHRALTPTEIVEHHLDRSLQTDLDKEPLDHSLLQIYRKATSIYEERGYNTLFLALGFLHWTESPAAPEVLRAPLLLLPVELSRASLRAPFRLRAREEDPILNPALVQRLKTDFGIELPPLPDTLEEIDPQAVFDGFARAIAGMDRWAVSNRIYLGLFSFMKFFMYKDLEVHGETFLKNAAVAWLAGEPDLLARTAKEIPAGAQLDRIPPEKSFQVLDADSSQQEVIEAAKQGHHMVIEGPPGTGKSQTITNLVAEFLNSGKTVLFVSEKMAALRVVYERLQRVGLGDFCMELHSQMTSKRQVMEDLGRTLNLPREAPSIDAASLARVGALRDELNAYVKELGEPVGGIAAAPFEMFGRLEALQTAPDAPVALRGTARWTAQKVQDLEGKVRSLSAAAERVHPVQDNPWRGARLTDAPYSRVVEIQAAIRALLAAHADHERLSSDLAAALETRDAANFGEAEALVDLARLLVESPRPDPAQLADARWDHPSPDLQEVLENGKSHDAAVEELRRRYTDGVLGIDAESMQAWWLVFGSGLFRWLRPTWWRIRSAFKLHRKPGAGTRPLEDLNLVVKAQLSKRRIEKFDGLAAFGSRWTGVDSPWGELQRLADWLVRFRSHVRSGLASARCLRLAASGLQGTDVGRVEGALRSLRHAWDDLSRLLDFGDPVPDLEPMRDRVEAMRDREAGLSDWARYCAARAGLAATEAAALVPHLAGLSPGQYEPTFQKQWVRSWLEEVLPARPLLAAFDGAEHDRRVASFRDLDRLQMEINRRRCRAGLLSKLPDAGWDASPGSELAILQREVRKKRRHLPIRKLFSEVPNCLRSVKPCLMMSPLS
ncbi:MAG TPA: DUF4011 domain-containing protein, partial [Planctomycetota bacterium]|nr:DUF4011 domain-containing protein [Planctomycetota bacterium]